MKYIIIVVLALVLGDVFGGILDLVSTLSAMEGIR